jgi:hypothetical protein
MSVPLRFDTLIRTTPSKGSCESLDVRATRRVVISTIIGTGQAEDKVKTIIDAYQKSTAPAVLRSRERIERLFGDLDLIAPGAGAGAGMAPRRQRRDGGRDLVGARRSRQDRLIPPARPDAGQLSARWR